MSGNELISGSVSSRILAVSTLMADSLLDFMEGLLLCAFLGKPLMSEVLWVLLFYGVMFLEF